MRNILEIIKEMPEGRELFSMVTGVGTFRLSSSDNTVYPITLRNDDGGATFNKYGCIYDNCKNSLCVIFPSEDSRDWYNWAEKLVKDGDIVKMKDGKVVRFNYRLMRYDDVARFASDDELEEEQKKDEQPTEKAIFAPKAIFEPFDKVLVADRAGDKWKCNFFSHYVADDDEPCKFRCISNSWKLCIPFDGNENLAGHYVTEEQVAEVNKIYNK